VKECLRKGYSTRRRLDRGQLRGGENGAGLDVGQKQARLETGIMTIHRWKLSLVFTIDLASPQESKFNIETLADSFLNEMSEFAGTAFGQSMRNRDD
jgi:hypothetical protein